MDIRASLKCRYHESMGIVCIGGVPAASSYCILYQLLYPVEYYSSGTLKVTIVTMHTPARGTGVLFYLYHTKVGKGRFE